MFLPETSFHGKRKWDIEQEKRKADEERLKKAKEALENGDSPCTEFMKKIYEKDEKEEKKKMEKGMKERQQNFSRNSKNSLVCP